MKRPAATPSRPRPHGFTLVEVMVASALLALGVAGVLAVSQQGLQAFDTARNLAAASQVMQSEMERLRLMSWQQLQAVQDSAQTVVAVQAGGDRYHCTREIRDVKANMKEVTLIAEWAGFDGHPHTARLITRYGKSGLNDYFYTTH